MENFLTPFFLIVVVSPILLGTFQMFCTSAINRPKKTSYMIIMITDEDTYILQVYILDKLNSSTELNTLHAILQITVNFNSRIAIYGVAQQNRKKIIVRYTCCSVEKLIITSESSFLKHLISMHL